MHEEKPLELIPYYDLVSDNFLTSEEVNAKNTAVRYKITYGTLQPSISITGFQHSVIVSNKSGTLMKWNSNVSPADLTQASNRMYGTVYGGSKV